MTKHGHESVASEVEVVAGAACPDHWPKSGTGILDQDGYDLQLGQETNGFRGAIIENHMVFMVLVTRSKIEFDLEPIWGDWTGSSVELRGNNPECKISVTKRT
jgi:hypothetical protein